VDSCLELLSDRKVQVCLISRTNYGQKFTLLPQYIILVGGFGESPYLKKKLAELFDRHGASIVTAEEPSSV
jgi:hypothetical protein